MLAMEQIEAEAVVREARVRTLRAIARANGSGGRAGELRQLDADLLARSTDLIARGRQRLKQLSAEAR